MAIVNSINDLKQRTLVESNTLRSYLLSVMEGGINTEIPSLDNVQIHEYQIANSITLNIILSNFIVDFKQAKALIDSGIETDSYFAIVTSTDEKNNLPDQTRLFLDISNEDSGSFYSRQFALTNARIANPNGVDRFVNLDNIWYGIATINGNYDNILLIPGLNNDGELENKFDIYPVYIDDEKTSRYSSFNEFLKDEDNRATIISLPVENKFKGNYIFNQNVDSEKSKNEIFKKCDYLFCLSTGFYGIYFNDNNTYIYDIGKLIGNFFTNNLYDSYEFKFCDFKVVDEVMSLFVVVQEKFGDENYHYLYANEDDLDPMYGFNEIKELDSNGLIVHQTSVFQKVQSFKQLDDVTIALTDYGFWDVEPNSSEEILSSYNKGDKNDRTFSSIAINNSRTDKVVHPTFEAKGKICEYDKDWITSSELITCGEISYPKVIYSSHNVVGCTDDFSVYNTYEKGSEPAYLMVKITLDQFKQILFSNQTLLKLFIQWLFNQVMDIRMGEAYLERNNSLFLEELETLTTMSLSNLQWQATASDSILQSRFASIPALIITASSSTSLGSVCTQLNDILEASHDNGWFFTGLEAAIKDRFINDFPTKYLSTTVNDIVDGLVEAYPLLSYFREYLTNHLTNDYKNLSSVDISISDDTYKSITTSIIDYIKSQVKTALVLGGYDETKTGNDCYPNIDSYLGTRKIELGKADVEYILSTSNTKASIQDAVDSMPFFNDYTTYSSLASHEYEDSAFNITVNEKFAEKTGLVSSAGNLNIYWDDVRKWLLDDSINMSNVNLLKALIRTQFYRSIYFKADDYTNFTSDKSKYYITTSKSYENYEGETYPLVLLNGSVDANGSGLDDSHIQNIEYRDATNQLQYEIHSDTIQIVDNKFVYSDVEYYVSLNNIDTNQVNTLYFNEFQDNLPTETVSIKISSGKFTLNGVDYQINGNILSMDNFEKWDNSIDNEKEFRQEIVDNRFSINGIQYVIKDGYVTSEYLDQSKLIAIKIAYNTAGHNANEGFGWFNSELEFHFTNADQVEVIRYYRTNIIDKLTSEWCEYDDKEITIDDTYTLEWHYANFLQGWKEDGINISSVGNGILYDGVLYTDCTISLTNSIEAGYVIGNLSYTFKKADGSEETVSIGQLYNSQMNQISDKTIIGTLENYVVTKNTNGDKVFINKTLSKIFNTLTSIWVDKRNWDSSISVVSYGVCEFDDDGIGLVTTEDGNIVTLTPYQDETKYSIHISGQDKSLDTVVNKIANCVSFIDSNGTRYTIDTTVVDGTNNTNKLVFNEMNGRFCDFTTQYGDELLKDTLTTNIKQAMNVQIVQNMVDNGDQDKIVISMDSDLGLYLDLFSDDSSIEHYNNLGGESTDKYSEVYKNNIGTIDDSNIYLGKAYQYLDGLVEQVFQDANGVQLDAITLSEEPSFYVNRVSKIDIFTYKVYLNISIKVSSKMVKNENFSGKYLIGDATIKDIECDVTFTPKFIKNGTMTYDVEYKLNSKNNAIATYSSIIYNLDNKAKTKILDQSNTVQIDFPEFLFSSNDVSIGNLTSDLVSSRLNSDLLKDSDIGQLFILVNSKVSGRKLVKQEIDTEQWDLNAGDPQIEENQKIIERSRGYAKIEDKTYKVSDDDTKLIPIYGGNELSIKYVNAHTSVDTDDANWDVNTELCGLLVDTNTKIVSKEYLNKYFTIKTDEYEKYLVYDLSTISDFIPEHTTTSFNGKQYYLFDTDTDTEVEVGQDLDENEVGSFTYTINDLDTQIVDGKYNATISLPGNWQNGNVKVTISNIPTEVDEDSGEANVDDCTASISDITDRIVVETPDDNYSDVFAYTPLSVENLTITPSTVTEEKETEEEIGEGDDAETITETTSVTTIKQYTITFSLKLNKHTKYICYIPQTDSESYNYPDGLWFTNGKILRSIELTDVNKNPIGSLGYALAQFPTNIESGVTSYSELVNGAAYIEFNNSTITSDGFKVLFDNQGENTFLTMSAIDPEESWSNSWDIYGRYIKISTSIYSEHENIKSIADDKMVWLNSSNTKKSIRITCDDNIWNGLIGDAEPQALAEKIEDLVFKSLKLSDDTLELELNQLKSFLTLIDAELKQSLSQDDLADICLFTFSCGASMPAQSGDWNSSTGLFGWGRTNSASKYQDNLAQFNAHLFSQFYADFAVLDNESVEDEFGDRDYHDCLNLKDDNSYPEFSEVNAERETKLVDLHKYLGTSNGIFEDVFGEESADDARYINAIKTTIKSQSIDKMYVADDVINIFTVNSSNGISWYTIDSSNVSKYIDEKVANINYAIEPQVKILDYEINNRPEGESELYVGLQGKYFRFANRDLTPESSSISRGDITDTMVVRCLYTEAVNGNTKDEEKNMRDLWYLSSLDAYIYSKDQINDMAYEEKNNQLYVIFSGDQYVYRFDDLDEKIGYDNRISLQKVYAAYTIKTRHSSALTDKSTNKLTNIYLDYSPNSDDDDLEWSIYIYGQFDNTYDVEVWNTNPGSGTSNFVKCNTIFFGDNLFSDAQLTFQNISKNKEMYDILDVDAVDGCYYGLVKDENKSTNDTTLYAIFKTPSDEDPYGVVQKLPYEVVNSSMYRAADTLYSLWVVTRAAYEWDDDGNPTKYKNQLSEISVPNTNPYIHRTIDIDKIINSDGAGGTLKDPNELEIHTLIMSKFVTESNGSSFIVLSNLDDGGLNKVAYEVDEDLISIDKIDTFNEALKVSMQTIFDKHIKDYHTDNDYFSVLASKVNQYADDFDVFDLFTNEFGETQIVGVVPTSKVDDTDEVTDHRVDSVQASTDILTTDGLLVESDTNPGMITGAISNPATTYDDDTVYTKAQRNPSLEGSEFYDYIYDQDGTVLLDLYAISYIYKVHTNNTYDLYINIPTTRTKYINRIAGTLKDDLTSQVQTDDTRTRVNFADESMPNNLDESTTHLRIYIDRKFISIGNVELVEISGNSIPTLIYRDDGANDGFYDSIALESRWDGKVNEILEPTTDTNKVYLEFEVYGTDSQSIHIQGKTLINPYLDDDTYDFS